jgi:hypothetical protein
MPNNLAKLCTMTRGVAVTESGNRMRARIAANTRWAFEEDRSAATAPARRAAEARFERLVDPDGVLDPHERALRAEAARRAHFLRMAAKSAAVRRAKAAGTRRSVKPSDVEPPDVEVA